MTVLAHAWSWMGPKGWVCGRRELPAPLSEGLGPGPGHSCQEKDPPQDRLQRWLRRSAGDKGLFSV